MRIAHSRPRILLAWIVSSSCTNAPADRVQQIERALAAGDVADVIDADYVDPLGDAEAVRRSVREFARFSSRRFELGSGETQAGSRGLRVRVQVEADLIGTPTSFRFLGPMDLELSPVSHKVVGGLLVDLRDAMTLVDRLETAEDRTALVHPASLDPSAREKLPKGVTFARVERFSARGDLLDDHQGLALDLRSTSGTERFEVRRAAGRLLIWSAQ